MSETKKTRRKNPKVVKLPRVYQTRMPFDGGELIVYCVKLTTIANLNWVVELATYGVSYVKVRSA